MCASYLRPEVVVWGCLLPRECLCVSHLFYGGDSDNKEEGQAAGDWAGGGVDDELQGREGDVGWGRVKWGQKKQELGVGFRERQRRL